MKWDDLHPQIRASIESSRCGCVITPMEGEMYVSLDQYHQGMNEGLRLTDDGLLEEAWELLHEAQAIRPTTQSRWQLQRESWRRKWQDRHG